MDATYLAGYQPKNKIRIITSTALFDGHDASINIMRRLLQQRGAEIIHLGHNRSALEVAAAALQEDVHAVALSSYQGGHMEYFAYLRQLLDKEGGERIKIYAGGGGVIVPAEIEKLGSANIAKVFSPQDGQRLGLSGIIGTILMECDAIIDQAEAFDSSERRLSRALTLLENQSLSLPLAKDYILKAKAPRASKEYSPATKKTPVLGVTGTGGAGKSSLCDELIGRFLLDNKDIKIGVVCVDPSKKKTGGALLGDRIRMNAVGDARVFLRSFATRDSGAEIAKVTLDAVELYKSFGFDLIIVESSGIGQGDAKILEVSDISLYVMTAEYGASTQLEKINMLDYADFVAVNKFERPQSLDAYREVKDVIRRSRFAGERNIPDDKYPVYGTIASRFADDGVNGLFKAIVTRMNEWAGESLCSVAPERICAHLSTKRDAFIPQSRTTYLKDIAECVRNYRDKAAKNIKAASMAEAWRLLIENSEQKDPLWQDLHDQALREVEEPARNFLAEWQRVQSRYNAAENVYFVRQKEVRVPNFRESLSGLKIPRVTLPRTTSYPEVLKYFYFENLPGFFPFTAGVFPFRREGEDPQRMFAGEGGPDRTNRRFHFLSKDSAAKRLSTAFDSVTLYGADPDHRPDIFGKVGESGVSICTLEDMKSLYAGFDLCDPLTSVSMTINGPAPILLAFFLNTAIDQQIDKFHKSAGRAPTIKEREEICERTLSHVRGTVQADILKEDQAQNTCIFSIEFALKMMADVQEFFVEKKIRNYYSVSISGYHIAEAGANPITQLAFTLANGFTYVEYYLARGMKIDDFAPNLSFFFSNGLDVEYAVIGRVARRIWSIAMRDRYGASEQSQRLKYHIQTSGRSLHAMEISFNDIRTTLQALLALYDNCNSLHTNAYDEAITTPTEESVRRALAIQMIINKEFGANQSENINQGSYFLEALTDLVEEAVLQEFEAIARRGGVLGAMEMQYQRSKIQQESLLYETRKDAGLLPIIGVNTFLSPASENEHAGIPLARADYEEKESQIRRLGDFKAGHAKKESLEKLSSVALAGGNIFAELMTTVRHASLGEITETLYKIGGKYRRSL